MIILNNIYKNRWTVEENDNFVFEQRMVDYAVKIPKLSERFKIIEYIHNKKWVDGGKFHNEIKMVYNGKGEHFKESGNMADVCYTPAHLNEAYSDKRRGDGKCAVKWIYSEQAGTEENFLTKNLSRLDRSFRGI